MKVTLVNKVENIVAVSPLATMLSKVVYCRKRLYVGNNQSRTELFWGKLCQLETYCTRFVTFYKTIPLI